MSADVAAFTVSRMPHEPDRHAGEIDDIVREVLDGPGVTTRGKRLATLEGSGPEQILTYLAKVRDQSYRVSEDDFAALRAEGLSEDTIFELTVAAAIGAASRRLEAARRAMRRAP